MYFIRLFGVNLHIQRFSYMIRLVIFDFDGTLGDTRRNIILTMQQTLSRLGYPVFDEDTIAATIGLPLATGFAVLLPNLSQEDAALCATTYREIFEENRILLVPKLFPRVKETLSELHRRGYVLTVASSRSSRSLNGFLADMDIASEISYVLGADNVAKAKPDPEPVLQTLRELGFASEETLVVGDMPVDILMGARAGAHTCAVTYGNASAETLRTVKPDYLIDSISELLAIL